MTLRTSSPRRAKSADRMEGQCGRWGSLRHCRSYHSRHEPQHAFSVEVQPEYLAGQSGPAQDDYQFAYTVTVTNQGTVAAQLISRHWVISDAPGHTQEVKGLGVVGRQPLLQPGESFQYTSGCPCVRPRAPCTAFTSGRTEKHSKCLSRCSCWKPQALAPPAPPGCEGAALNAPLDHRNAELEHLLAWLDPSAAWPSATCGCCT
jgi:uncharacterized protein affecting Mg2+/Co2+ transport